MLVLIIEKEVLCQTFVHKSLWGYGGNAPVALRDVSHSAECDQSFTLDWTTFEKLTKLL